MTLNRNHDTVDNDNQPFCEKINAGAISFLPNYIHLLYHHAGGNVHLLVDRKLVLWAAWDANINGLIFSSALT